MCINDCATNSIACLSTCGSGLGSGGGGDGAPQLSPEEMRYLESCNDAAFTAANADGDELLNGQEFENQIDLMAAAMCPDVEIQNKYHDNAVFTSVFDSMSCDMCSGVFDPFNQLAIEGDDAKSCGCETSNIPINLPAQTSTEINVYCVAILPFVLVQCLQPLPSCVKACEMQAAECTRQCNIKDRQDVVLCLDKCVPKATECLSSCERDPATLSNGGSSGSGANLIFFQTIVFASAAVLCMFLVY
eukprot:CAMPEP_0178915008 /NCGR_PEP_ID=MMETSP0786-20121207/11767_1 /TAXON_ID=186022 /ORGANISM="Thalassionema frauenfeldii, Strain CCMP 1798" /LENGTH=245 /DNA_ID=CAMNT_0020588029 /DNA_START=104 /DNA_END=841 /DNA_ORIENTATION=-